MSKSVSDELYRLIHSLTKPERAYFTLYASSFSKGTSPLHLKLFKLISTQKKYDENKILKQLVIKKPHLSRLKNYLYAQLLKCLHYHNSKTNTGIEIQELIHHAEILTEKKLYGSANKILKKATLMAEEYENIEQLMLISSVEKKLIRKEGSFNKMKYFNEHVHKKRVGYIKLLDNALQYESLSVRLWDISIDGSQEKIRKNTGNLKRILNHPLLSSPSEALSIKSKSEYFNIHFTCSSLLNKLDKNAYQIQKSWLEYIENNSQKTEEYKQYYLVPINNMIIINNSLRNFKDSDRLFNKAVQFTSSLSSNENVYEASSNLLPVTNNYISGLILNGNYGKAIETVETVKKLQHKISAQSRSMMVLFGNALVACILQQNYSEALKYLNKITGSKSKAANDVQQTARILSLIIYYESGNNDRLPAMARSVRRYLLKNIVNISEHDKLILDYFEHILPDISGKKEEVKTFRKWKTELLQLPAESVIPEDTFDFISWIDSKIESRTLAEIMMDKPKEKNK